MIKFIKLNVLIFILLVAGAGESKASISKQRIYEDRGGGFYILRGNVEKQKIYKDEENGGYYFFE